MPRAERPATLDTVVRSSRDTPIALGRVAPLGTELQEVATDVLHGVQYSFLAAAAHPQIRFPFGSLEEAFQGAIALRPAERRWVYHARARQIAVAPLAARQAAFGRYGRLSVEEFGRVGLVGASARLPALRADPRQIRAAKGMGTRPPLGADVPVTTGARTTLALYITEVGCLDQTMPEALRGEEIVMGGLALDPGGEIAKVGQFLVRDDFENGVLKDYGIPGRKFCEFPVPETLGNYSRTYGVAAFLAVADRAGFSDSLTGALAKAGPILRGAVEARVARVHPVTISQVVGRVVERFVQWLTEAFQDDVFPPGLAFAGLHPGFAAGNGNGRDGGDITGALGQFTVAGHRGRYQVGGQWRVTHS